jgi:hypothetical protein
MTCWNCGDEPAVTPDGLGEDCDALPMRPSRPMAAPGGQGDPLFEEMMQDAIMLQMTGATSLAEIDREEPEIREHAHGE